MKDIPKIFQYFVYENTIENANPDSLNHTTTQFWSYFDNENYLDKHYSINKIVQNKDVNKRHL